MTSIDRPDTSRLRIVVGVDGSEGGRAALRYAFLAAAARGASLEVVSGYAAELYWAAGAPMAAGDLPALSDAVRDSAQGAVDSVRGSVPEAAGVPVDVRVTAEAAAHELVQRSHGADLVVVGSRGHGAVRSALLGSVALHVSTHAACPVVVVRALPADASAAPADAPRVVVGVDGSPTGRAALAEAVEEAVRLGAALHVVACFVVDTRWPALRPDMMSSADEIRDDVRRQVQEQLTAVLAARPGDAPAPPVHLEVIQGAPSDVLVEQAHGAALLAVGSRGRGAVRSALMGSVALHCITHAPCPVLVVRPVPADAPGAAVPASARV